MAPAIKIFALALVLVVSVTAQQGGYGGYEGGFAAGNFGGSNAGHSEGAAGGNDAGNAGASGSDNYGHHEEYYHHPKYEYKYAVHDDKTHDIKSHSEHRDGDKTEGEYSFVEADGTTRTVKYHVHGKSGFVATVHRSGHAVHPQVQAHHQPAYHHGGYQQQQGEAY